MIPAAGKISLLKIQWLIWAILFTVHVLALLPYDPLSQSLLYSVINVGSYAIIIYGNAFFLLPKLYEKNSRVLYALLAVLLVTAVALLRYMASFYIYNWFFAAKLSPFRWSAVGSSFISSLLIYLTSVLFYITLDFFRLKQKQEQLQKQHAETELKLLKAQVQPHFLFNTLNNIYYVAQRESPATAALLEQLSLIMRYFVEDAPKERIPLLREMDFIRNYLSLENMRMRYPVNISIQEQGIHEKITVPPMLLIPLVENVFKHGIDKLREDNFISLSVSLLQNRVEAVVENRMARQGEVSNTTGTGLANLASRLKLLYGNDYVLFTGEAGMNYRAQINIPL